MAFLRRLSGDVAFYGTLDIVQRAVSVLLVPVYTRVLSQQDFGNMDLIVTACSLLSVFVDLQQIQGFMRFYPEHLRAGTGNAFVGTNLIGRLGLSISITLLFLSIGALGGLELSIIPSFQTFSGTWIAAACSVPIGLALDLLLVQTRMLRSKKLFALGTLINVVSSTVLCIILIVWMRWGLLGAVLGQTLGKLLSLGILGWALRYNIAFSWNRSILRQVLRHTLPIVPGWIFGFSSTYIGRFFLYSGMGASEVAILALCMKVANIIALFSLSFRMAWQPLAMLSIGEEKGREQFADAMRVFLIGGLLSICALAVFAKPIVSILAPASYAGAASYVVLFAISSIIGAIEFNMQLGNQIAGKTYWMSVSAFAGLMFNILILITLTNKLGLIAIVLGAFASSIVRVIIGYISSQANHPVPYERMTFIYFGIGCIIAGALPVVRSHVPSVFPIIFLVLFALGVSWMSFTIGERHKIKGMLYELVFKSHA